MIREALNKIIAPVSIASASVGLGGLAFVLTKNVDHLADWRSYACGFLVLGSIYLFSQFKHDDVGVDLGI